MNFVNYPLHRILYASAGLCLTVFLQMSESTPDFERYTALPWNQWSNKRVLGTYFWSIHRDYCVIPVFVPFHRKSAVKSNSGTSAHRSLSFRSIISGPTYAHPTIPPPPSSVHAVSTEAAAPRVECPVGFKIARSSSLRESVVVRHEFVSSY